MKQDGRVSLARAARLLRRRLPAFTLIELLVAISILAAIMTVVYTALYLVTGQSQVVTQENSEDQELRLLARLISQDLQAVRYLDNFAVPAIQGGTPRPTGLVARMVPAGTGEFSQLSFHAAVPSRQHRMRPPEGDPNLHEIGYFVQEDIQTKDRKLVRREDYYLNDDLENGGVTTVLAGGIETFKVEFLLPAAAPGQTQEQWVTDWNSANQPKDAKLPIAIRLTLGQLGKSGRHLKQVVEINLQLVKPK